MKNGEQDDWKQYDSLSDVRKTQLQEWIATNLKPVKTPWRGWAAKSSYGLKHTFAHDVATQADDGYVTNGQFKGAMRAAGYEPVNESGTYWEFRCRPIRGTRLRAVCYGDSTGRYW